MSNNEQALRKENRKLREENKRLAGEKEKILRDFEKTKKEFEEYKTKHVMPVNELRKSLNIKKDKRKKHGRLGAPIEHKGYTRCIPERIDCVKELNPEKCPGCNSDLSDTQEIRSRYMTDLEFSMSVKTTRYDIHRKYCSKCGKLVELKPKEILPNARFGLKLMLFIMYLRLALRTPSKKIAEYMQDIHGLRMCESEVYCIMKQLTNLFGNHYKYLEKLGD